MVLTHWCQLLSMDVCDIDSVSGDVDTVLSGAVSSGLCDLDRVS